MKKLCLSLFFVYLFAPFLTAGTSNGFDGRWALIPERSSALDGWTNMHLILKVDGGKFEITHDMRWRSTRAIETYSVKPGRKMKVKNFFRIEQRHMAVYPHKNAVTAVSAEWLDNKRTLRVEAEVPVEVSQGNTVMRITYEFRLGVDDDSLTLIELHSTRDQPLVYRFKKLPDGDSSRP
ncbi:MAG: hypothetical protein KJT03_12080 [Verrucomicrobiae bacterium]|nr:hypothetical protein [Verrucomicrobiae bacterium]